MTRFVEPAVLACPRCESPILKRRIASLNFFGIHRYSDGSPGHWAKDVGRMACCPACDNLFWRDEAQPLGVMPREPRIRNWSWMKRALASLFGRCKTDFAEESAWTAIPESWHWARQIEAPKGRDFLWALEHGFGATAEDEIYLRTELWWSGNRPKRGSKSDSPMTADQERENMMRLLDLLQAMPPGNREPLIEAELLRALGRFEECIALLNNTTPTDSEMAQSQLARAKAADASLFSLESEGSMAW